MSRIYFSYLLFTLCLASICLSARSQVKISTAAGSPNQGAMLEVESNNRGFLPPRIFLTNPTMYLNGSAPIEGTMIFSINWSGDGSLGGLQIWKTNRWFPLDASMTIPVSHVRVARNSDQNLGTGQTDLIWQQLVENQQPTGDLPMWSTAEPNKIIIRRRGWYFVSASCRMDRVAVNESRYINIYRGGQQVTAAGYNPPGNLGEKNDITLHASTTIFCEVNDVITLASFNSTPVVVTPSGLQTTQLSVTQLANYF